MSTSSAPASAASSESLSSIVSRAMTAKSSWPEKDTFLDVLYWLRQALGVVAGLAFGVVGLKGAVALALFVALSAGVGYAYAIGFQGVDEEVRQSKRGKSWRTFFEDRFSKFHVKSGLCRNEGMVRPSFLSSSANILALTSFCSLA